MSRTFICFLNYFFFSFILYTLLSQLCCIRKYYFLLNIKLKKKLQFYFKMNNRAVLNMKKIFSIIFHNILYYKRITATLRVHSKISWEETGQSWVDHSFSLKHIMFFWRELHRSSIYYIKYIIFDRIVRWVCCGILTLVSL